MIRIWKSDFEDFEGLEERLEKMLTYGWAVITRETENFIEIEDRDFPGLQKFLYQQ